MIATKCLRLAKVITRHEGLTQINLHNFDHPRELSTGDQRRVASVGWAERSEAHAVRR
jgi:hypothetical protein